MSNKACSNEVADPVKAAELDSILSRVYDAIERIRSMREYSRKVNDALYGVVPSTGVDAEKDVEPAGAMQKLRNAVEAIHNGCSILSDELSRQENLA